MQHLQKLWRRRLDGAFFPSPTLSDEGLFLGAATLICHALEGGEAVESELDRMHCLLSIATGRSPNIGMMVGLRKALQTWQSGQKGLAQIYLEHSRYRGLIDETDAWRLFLAETLIDAGLSVADLRRELSLPAASKLYNPDQPRNPAGSGREAGQWTSSSSTVSFHASPSDTASPGGAPERARPKLALLIPSPSLLQPLAPSAIGWLARIASRLAGPFAFFGAIVIPEPNPGVATEGVLPDHPDITYQIDHDTGVLRLTSKGDSDPEDAIVALLGHDGLYRQIDSGKPIGRVLPNGAVIVDIEDEQATNAAAHEEPGGAGRPLPVPPRQPKLCPDPGPDAGRHYGFSAAYELYVRDHVNPQRIPQLPVGLTFALPSDAKRGWTYYDDCQESTGKMIDAKSDESGFMLSDYGSRKVKERYLKQALDQVRAAQGRPVEWYFHWKKAASLAEALFDSKNIPIRVHYLPYPGRSDD